MSRALDSLPEGQRRVVTALLEEDAGCTYAEVADRCGIHLGTVHTHLRRLRERRPLLYARIVRVRVRARRLAEWYALAEARDREHSRVWHRWQRHRRYYYRFGFWPWEWEPGR